MTRWNDHHPTCPGGCGELADECRCPRPRPLGSMTITERAPDALDRRITELTLPDPNKHPAWCKCQRVCGGDQ